ncbi:MAG: MFS transporter [Acidobacteriia bacterium]|nr:MFS transporter [Terriglobia bacterium]
MTIPVEGRILPFAPEIFRALRHRNFLFYWTGQFVSLIGTWMQSVAQGWLVFRLSNSAFQLGVVGFCAFSPMLVFTLVGGVLADRVHRKTALLWTQSLSMVQAGVLTYLTASGSVRVWHVAILALLLGTVNAFDVPIRQTFLFDLVGREDLPNGIALNSMAFNSARLVGPAIAGLILAEFGETACFLLNAVSYLAVLVGLALIRVGEKAPAPDAMSWTAGIREGIAYAWRTPRVRTILLLVAVSSIFGMSYSILMPAIARDVLGGGQRTLGFLMGAAGAGAVLGALSIARRRSTRRSGVIVAAAMTLFGAGLFAFSFSRTFWLSAALLVVIGGAMIVQMATSNAFLQLVAPPDLRGRVVSLYALMFLGMAPFGSLLSGSLAKLWGTPVAVRLGGVVCIAAALAFASRAPRLSAARESVSPDGAA